MLSLCTMPKTIKTLSTLILIVSILLFPLLGIGIIFGLAGSTAKYFILIGFGYVGIVISSLVCIFRPKYYPAILISLALIIVGGIGDARFWSQHNAQLCADLRADPTCVESSTGFQCTDFRGEGGFSVGGGICEEKLSIGS